MSLVGYKVKNHPQQVTKRGAKAEIDDRATPPEVFDPLHKRFDFTIDVAALAHNTKCERFYTPTDDGLAKVWDGERVWCNPPHSNIATWVSKAWLEWSTVLRPEVIVMLLPANRTEQGWWQEMVEPFRDRRDSPLKVEFIKGRTRFIRVGSTTVGPDERPPYGCCLVIWSTE